MELLLMCGNDKRELITTVTLNAALDKTYFLDRFPLGEASRILEMHVYPGGKGVNVAKVAHLLGERPLTTGFVAGFIGSAIEAGLAKLGIAHDFVRVSGESRLALTVIDNSGLTTELIEPGPAVTANDLAKLKCKIKELAAHSRIVVFSGSAAPSSPFDVYAGLVETAKLAGALVLLDTSGRYLSEAIDAQPYMIKPNEHEIAQLAGGKKPENEEELLAVIRSVMKKNIPLVAVSLGANGALVGFEGLLFRVMVPRIKTVNTVGCGDSFVAGIAVGLLRGMPIEECLRLAAACGTANAMMPEAGSIRIPDVEGLMRGIEISLLR